MASKKVANLLEKLVPVLLVASVALAFVVGILWQRVSKLEKGGAEVAGAADPTPAAGDPQAQPPTGGKLSSDQVDRIVKVSDKDHVKGSMDAEVFLIEYSDFECPFCSRFHTTAQQVVDEYEGKVAWVYRHFPLDQLHQEARPAAEASECIAELSGEDAFWAFTDEVFKDQASSLNDLEGVASKVGVNRGEFKSCVDSERYKDKVEEQHQGGLAAGVTGTPGNFILNEKGEAWFIPGAFPFEQMKMTIDEALSS